MTTTPAERADAADDGRAVAHPDRLDQPRVDVPEVAHDSDLSMIEGRLREVLAPFVAWLATQDLDEPDRRRHRATTERFLRWAHTDTGPLANQRRRYERHLHRHDPGHLHDADVGLGWWTHHRQLLARTLPFDR